MTMNEEIPVLVPEMSHTIETMNTIDIPTVHRTRSKRNAYYTEHVSPFDEWYQGNEDNYDPFWQNMYDDYTYRDKREVQYSPNYDDDMYLNNDYNNGPIYPDLNQESYIRDKRQTELEGNLNFWQGEYTRCKKSAPDNPECERFRQTVDTIIDELERSFSKMKRMLRPRENSFRDVVSNHLESDDRNYQPDREQMAEYAEPNLIPQPVHEDLSYNHLQSKHGQINFNPNVEGIIRQRDNMLPYNLPVDASNMNSLNVKESQSLTPRDAASAGNILFFLFLLLLPIHSTMQKRFLFDAI